MRSGQLLALFLLAAFVVVASRSFAISGRYCNRHEICTEHVPLAFHKNTATTAHVETTETAETAETAEPATPVVVNSAATREAEVEGASGAVEIGKAIAAAQVTSQATFNLRLKLLAVRHIIGTDGLDDDMNLVDNAVLRLVTTADEEAEAACYAAFSAKNYYNVDINHAEKVALKAAAGRKWAHDLHNFATNDYADLRYYQQAAVFAEYHANWRAKAWKGIAN
ncbi:hypothetical protein GGH93_005671 [Coemansia aciculifera]|nr:hypothetical protein GGH93_005671 [Coemansia aciculifera]